VKCLNTILFDLYNLPDLDPSEIDSKIIAINEFFVLKRQKYNV